MSRVVWGEFHAAHQHRFTNLAQGTLGQNFWRPTRFDYAPGGLDAALAGIQDGDLVTIPTQNLVASVVRHDTASGSLSIIDWNPYSVYDPNTDQIITAGCRRKTKVVAYSNFTGRWREITQPRTDYIGTAHWYGGTAFDGSIAMLHRYTYNPQTNEWFDFRDATGFSFAVNGSLIWWPEYGTAGGWFNANNGDAVVWDVALEQTVSLGNYGHGDHATAVRHPNYGGRILVLGGTGTGNFATLFETDGTWQRVADTPTAFAMGSDNPLFDPKTNAYLYTRTDTGRMYAYWPTLDVWEDVGPRVPSGAFVYRTYAYDPAREVFFIHATNGLYAYKVPVLVAPSVLTLSAPTVTAVTATSATPRVTLTNAAAGTLHYAIYPSAASAPTFDGTTWSGTPVTTGSEASNTVDGVQTFAAAATGLDASTSYRIAFCWTDGVDVSDVAWSEPWATDSEVNQSLSLQWQILSQAQKSVDLRWNLLQEVTVSVSLLWKTLETLSKDSTLNFSLLQAATKDTTLLNNLLQAATKDTTHFFQMLQKIDADLELRWRLLAELGQVAAELQLLWRNIGNADKSVVLLWSQLESVLKDLQIQWLQLQAVEKSVQFDLSMLERVTADADLRWRLASVSSVVFADLDMRWSLIGRAHKDIEVNWSLLESVGVTADLRWQLLTAIEKEIALGWQSLNGATAELELQWSVVGNSAASVTLLWRLGDAPPIPPVPGSRIWVYPAENRVIVAQAENRVIVAQAENRVLVVN